MYLTKWITAACLAAFCVLGSAPAAAELGVDWERASNDHPFVLRQHVGLVEYRGKLYAGGGFRCADLFCGGKVRYGDLWESENGIDWRLIWAPAPDPVDGEFWTNAPQFLVFDDYFYYIGTSWGGLRTRDMQHWEFVDYNWNPLTGPLVEFKGVLFSPTYAEFSEDGVNFERRQDLWGQNPFSGNITAVSTEDYIYVLEQPVNDPVPRMWRTDDFENWTELSQGNVLDLEFFSIDDVRLTYFAGYLWLGGRFKWVSSTGSVGTSGRIWRSLDGENWELASTAHLFFQYEGGSFSSFGTTLYRLPGDGYSATYHSIGTCAEVLGGAPHAADLEGCGVISLSELLRVIQLFATQGYRCEPAEADGYAALAGTAASSAAAGASFGVAGFPDPATLLTGGLQSRDIPKGEEEGATEGTVDGEGTADGASEGEGSPEASVDGEGAAEGFLEGEPCTRHSADFADPAWRITLPELLRVVQLYNAGHYHPCPDADPTTEDGFCPGK